MMGRRVRSRRGVLFLLPMAMAFSFSLQEVDQSRLPAVLEAAADYCRMFGNASLNYVCLEEITEISYSPYQVVQSRYVNVVTTKTVNHLIYDYQLIKAGAKIEERRVLLEENGRKQRVPDAPLKVRRFPYRHIILGPMLVSEYWQPWHDYRIIGKERIAKEPCLVFEAVPKPGAETDHVFGKIWVSERDYRVLRLEWDQKSIENYKGIEDKAKKLGARPRIKLVMEFAHVNKGLRFPSQYVLSEEYVTSRGDLFIGSVTTVQYRDYRFFSVETEVDLKRGG